MEQPNVGIETELIIVDKAGRPVNKLPWEETPANASLIEIMKNYHKWLADAISGWQIGEELDASQIEIRTKWGKPLEEAIREIYELYVLVEAVIKNLWLEVLPRGVPDPDFIPMVSDKDRYREIHRILIEHWGSSARKATNIAWIHFHFELGSVLGEKELEKVLKVSRWIGAMVDAQDLESVWMSNERFELMGVVVNTLVKAGMLDNNNPVSRSIRPFAFESPQQVRELFVDGGWKIIPNYNLVGIKRHWEVYTLEVRTPDMIWPAAALPVHLRKIGSELLDVFNS